MGQHKILPSCIVDYYHWSVCFSQYKQIFVFPAIIEMGNHFKRNALASTYNCISTVASVLPKMDIERLISHSQKPSNNAAHFCISHHSIPFHERTSELMKSKLFSSSAASKYLEQLSHSTSLGRNICPASLWNTCRKHSTVVNQWWSLSVQLFRKLCT